MTPAEFRRAIAASPLTPDGLTVRACRLVLVDGISQAQAAEQIGVEQSAVSRALKKIPTAFCPRCRQALPTQP